MVNRADIKKITIKKRILAIIMALVAVAILFLSAASTFGFTSTARKTFNQKADTINSYVSVLVDSKLKEIESSVNNNISSFSLNNSQEIKEKVKNMQENLTDAKAVYYCNEADKRVDIYPEADTSSIDVSQREWYINAKGSNGKFAITDVYNDKLSGDNIITMSRSIFADGKFIGVIGIDYNLKDLALTISDLKFGDSGSIVLTDKKGTIISGEEKSTNRDKGFIGDELFNKIKDSESGELEVEASSDDLRVSFYTLPETGWKLMLQVSLDEFNLPRNNFIKQMLIVASILLVLSIISANLFSKSLTKNMNKVNDGIFRSSNGNFSEDVKVNSRDELGDMAENFNNMQKNISNLISMTEISVKDVDKSSNNLAEMSEQVSKAMNDVSMTITEISKGSMESAQSLETLLSSLDDISKQISSIDNLSNSIEKLANETNKLSVSGLDSINIVMDKSNETKDSTLNVTDVVLEVRDSVKNIALMNETISSITEQTNLLALNAAIEAARAGESGKGFAVVADEIRNLAEQTAVSAKNIDEVINNVVSTVDAAVERVEKTSSIVEAQQESVLDAKTVFDNINKQINSLTDHLKDIVSSIKTVNKNKDKIVNEAENISSIVEETAAGTEEVTATAQEVTASTEDVVNHVDRLKELSRILNNEIDKFKLKEI